VAGTVDGYTGITGNGLQFTTAGVNLTIQGEEGTNAGITNDSIRLFYLNNNAVLTLKNLHFAGNPQKSLVAQGGFLHVNGGGALFAEGCTFEDFSTAIDPAKIDNPNSDTNGGGLIYLNTFNAGSENPILSFKDCLFKNNFTTGTWGGGVIQVRDFGTPADPQVYFENCGFYGSRTERGNPGGSVIVIRGGAAATSQVSFVNSTITACGEGGSGAIAFAGGGITLNVINSTIKDNPVSGIMCWEQGTPTINIFNSVIENNTGTNMNDLRFSDKTVNEATINISNSLIGNPMWRNLTVPPYTKPAEYTVGTLFDALDEATISFTPRAGSLAVNYGDVQYLTALDINYDQLNNERWFRDDKCDAGAVELIRYPIFRGAGAWSETSRWNTGAIPASTDEVIIDGEVTVTDDAEVAGAVINAGKSVTINAGKQLTVNGAQSLSVNGTLNFLSDNDGTAQLNGVSNTPVNGTVNIVKTFDTDKWYPIGFPFEIAGVTIRQDGNTYTGDIYGLDTGAEVVANPAHQNEATTENIYLASYNGAANKFYFEGALEPHTGFVLAIPSGTVTEEGEIVEGTVEVTFIAAANTELNSTATVDISEGYTLAANPGLINAAGLSESDYYYEYDLTTQHFDRVAGGNALSAALKPFESIVVYKGEDTNLRASIGIIEEGSITALPLIGKDPAVETQYYNLQGIRVAFDRPGIYIVKTIRQSGKIESKIIRSK
jgi:hypothetical protein